MPEMKLEEMAVIFRRPASVPPEDQTYMTDLNFCVRVSSACIMDHQLVPETTNPFRHEGPIGGQYLLRAGDILLRDGDGMAALVREKHVESDRLQLGHGLVLIRCRPDPPLPPVVLYAWLKSEKGRRALHRLERTGEKYLPTKSVKGLTINVPEPGEVQNLAVALAAYEKLLTTYRERDRLMAELFESRLMAELFESLVHERFK